jgi:hypothetical protein
MRTNRHGKVNGQISATIRCESDRNEMHYTISALMIKKVMTRFQTPCCRINVTTSQPRAGKQTKTLHRMGKQPCSHFILLDEVHDAGGLWDSY